MNYTENMPPIPPIEAYDEDTLNIIKGFEDQDRGLLKSEHTPLRNSTQVSNAETIRFAEPQSFWRIEASSDWIERDLPHRQWLVQGYLMKGKVSASIGEPAAGKSTLALMHAISLALDVPFGDFIPIPLPGEARRARRVMVLNAEDDEMEQRRRISALIRTTGRKVSDLGDNLIRIRPSQDTAKLFEAGMAPGEVYAAEALNGLKATIKEQRVDVLMLDPLVEVMGGLPENDNATFGAVCGILRTVAEECGIAVLVVHHARKGEVKPGSLEAARGGGAFGGSVRCAHTVVTMTEPEAEALGIPKERRRYYLRVDAAKQSYAPPADGAVWFQRFSVELDNGESAPALEPWTPPKAVEMSLDELAPIAKAVQAGTDGGLPYSLKLSGDARSIKRMLDGKGISGKAAQDRIIQALRDKCGMVSAAFVRRNDQGQKRGSNLGARIGSLPAVEWVSAPSDNPGSSSGSENDDD